MRLRSLAIVAIVAVAPSARAESETARIESSPSASSKSPESRLSEGRLAYERGDYALAVRTLQPLLYPSVELASEEGVVEAHRLLALSYLLQKKNTEAEEEATSILALKPSFQLDPIVDPPMAVAFFESVRKRQGERLREARERERKAAEERAREEERRRRAQAERIYIERDVEHHSRLVATIPFGVGQWQNGQKTKGALFFSGEVVFGALSLASYIALERKYPLDATTGNRIHPFSEQSTAQALTGLQLASGIAFWATLVWGIIDAHVLFKREVVRTRELPKGTARSLQISPTVGPNQAGLGLQGRFYIMPSLRVVLPGAGPKVYHLYKKITSIGRCEENDIALPDPLLADAHAHIHFDGRDFHVTALDRHGDLTVNGRKRKKHRLVHQDQLRLGATDFTFSLYDEPVTDDEAAKTMEALNSYRKLLEFSEKLLGQYELGGLLESMMDSVIQISNAEKGFLLLLEGNVPQVKVARNLRRENLADALERLSDSIVEKVIRTKKPIIVSDAGQDAEFKNAMSVMSLKLSSVMCVPLLERGNLLGVIYVGNDSVGGLFEPSHLEVLTIFAAQASLILRNALLVSELKLDNKLLSDQLEAMRFGNLIGSAPAMQEVFRKVQKVATTDISVLITGETGTGKELIAHEVHRRSSRQKGPFVTINCGAIPENLLESELFGHVRGAFTGAVANKAGKFHAADRGTIFLDEIGEMPLQLQVKLLRVLQEKAVTRVGDTRAEPLDIRVIAATNRDLEAEIKAGRFREDLFYRLNVVNIHLPPLRERGDDVLVIAKYFLQRQAEELGSSAKGLSPNAAIAVRKFHWPGNIRQLENHIKKAVVLADKALLGPEDLGLGDGSLPEILPLAEAKEKFQRDYINHILSLNNGNRTKTARDLGVDPRTIFRHLEREDGVPPSEGDESVVEGEG